MRSPRTIHRPQRIGLAIAVVLTLICWTERKAFAFDTPTFGVGMETALVGTGTHRGSMLFIYDLGPMRLDASLGMGLVERAVSLAFGTRFFYVLHRASHADFSIGGGGYVLHGEIDVANVGRRSTRGEIEFGPQIRAFIVDNVALHGLLGIGIGFGDGGVSMAMTGQLSGTLGLAYFF